MRLLLDTRVLLWALADLERLPSARRAITDRANDVFVSAASAREIAIKRSLGTLDAPDDLAARVRAAGFEEAAVTIPHASAVGDLPRHHADPFDRLLVAQAQMEGLSVVTRDRRFAAYGVPVMPA